MPMPMPVPIQPLGGLADPSKVGLPTPAWGKAVPLPQHRDDFARLRRLLSRPGRFTLVIAQCGVAGYQDALIEAATAAASTAPPARWQLADQPDPDAVPRQLAEHASGAPALHLLGFDRWSDEDLHRLWRNLNVRRERLATELRLPVVLWLAEAQIRQLADQAPDLWAWRAAVLDFTPPGTPGAEAIWSDADEPMLLDREHAGERLRQLDAYLARRPEAEAEPDLLLEAAVRLMALGNRGAARQRAEQALRGFRAQGNGAGAARALMELGQAQRAEGRLDVAAALLREALSAAESALGLEHPTTAQALARLARARKDAGDLAGAEPLIRRALAIDERVYGPTHPQVAGRLDQLAGVLRTAGRIDESLAALDRAVAMLVGPEREADDVSLSRQLARVFTHRGNAHFGRVALDAAIADYDAAIGLGEALRTALGAQWPPAMQNDLAGVYSNRGAAHARRGALDVAIADFDAAIGLGETLRKALGAQWQPAMQNDLATVYMNRGNAHAGRGALDAAVTDYDAAIGLREALRTALGAQWQPAMQNESAVVYFNRGLAHGNADRQDDAGADFERAIAIARPLVAAHPDIPAWRETLARSEQGLALARRLAAGEAGGPG